MRFVVLVQPHWMRTMVLNHSERLMRSAFNTNHHWLPQQGVEQFNIFYTYRNDFIINDRCPGHGHFLVDYFQYKLISNGVKTHTETWSSRVNAVRPKRTFANKYDGRNVAKVVINFFSPLNYILHTFGRRVKWLLACAWVLAYV